MTTSLRIPTQRDYLYTMSLHLLCTKHCTYLLSWNPQKKCVCFFVCFPHPEDGAPLSISQFSERYIKCRETLQDMLKRTSSVRQMICTLKLESLPLNFWTCRRVITACLLYACLWLLSDDSLLSTCVNQSVTTLKPPALKWALKQLKVVIWTLLGCWQRSPVRCSMEPDWTWLVPIRWRVYRMGASNRSRIAFVMWWAALSLLPRPCVSFHQHLGW